MKARCTRDITKYFFSNKVINRWNALDQSVVGAASINAFKNSLEKVRSNRMGFFKDLSTEPWTLLVDDWLVKKIHKILPWHSKKTVCCCQIHRTNFMQQIRSWNRTRLAWRSTMQWIRGFYWRLSSRWLGCKRLWSSRGCIHRMHPHRTSEYDRTAHARKSWYDYISRYIIYVSHSILCRRSHISRREINVTLH